MSIITRVPNKVVMLHVSDKVPNSGWKTKQKNHQDTNGSRSNPARPQIMQFIKRHTAHTIVSRPKPKQWQMVDMILIELYIIWWQYYWIASPCNSAVLGLPQFSKWCATRIFYLPSKSVGLKYAEVNIDTFGQSCGWSSITIEETLCYSYYSTRQKH